MVALTLTGAKELGHGIWIAPLSPADVRRFGSNVPMKGGRSVVAVEGAQFESEKRTLSIPLDALVSLNIGQNDEAVFIELVSSDKGRVPNLSLETGQAPVSALDESFIKACQNERLPQAMIDIVTSVLNGVRTKHDDRLVEGVGRKWTAYPKNFVAITIQNTKKQFLISVKADPARVKFRAIELKRSRSPYAEFYLNSPSQVQEAIELILASAAYR